MEVVSFVDEASLELVAMGDEEFFLSLLGFLGVGVDEF